MLFTCTTFHDPGSEDWLVEGVGKARGGISRRTPGATFALGGVHGGQRSAGCIAFKRNAGARRKIRILTADPLVAAVAVIADPGRTSATPNDRVHRTRLQSIACPLSPSLSEAWRHPFRLLATRYSLLLLR